MTNKPLPASRFAQRLKEPYRHPQSALVHFETLPWCRSLIQSPHISPLAMPSLEPKATSEDALFATLLARNSQRPDRETIISCISYRGVAATAATDTVIPHDCVTGEGREYDEVLMLLKVGNGMDGHEGILHGGFIAMILDEVMGMAGGLYARRFKILHCPWRTLYSSGKDSGSDLL
jgi:hypothetical protein